MSTPILRERSGTSEVALLFALSLPLLLRAWASVHPGAWLWGFHELRYLPVWAWLLWAVAAAAIFVTPKSTRSDRRPIRAYVVAAVLATVMLVLVLPDRVQFVGDFLLRQGTAEESLPPSALFPQALPLDIFLHVALPTWINQNMHAPPAVASRILDALEAGALVLLGFAFARRGGLKGKEALACAVLVSWGGWLALFTGYSKAFTEMSLLVVACAISGVDALRGERRGYFYLCLAVAAGFAIHRSAVGFLPALAYVSWHALRAAPVAKPPRAKKDKAKTKAKEPIVPPWLPLLLPLVALALALPKMIMSATKLDTAHFAARGEGFVSVVRDLVAPLHLLDLINLLIFLMPLVALLLVPAPREGRPGPWSKREWIYLVMLGAPFWVITLVLRPAQGIPRDFDVFATPGVALAVMVAARMARVWHAAPGTARFAGAVIAGAMVPVLLTLWLSADLTRGLVRVNALADGPPLRSESERGLWREYLGARYHRAKRYKEATAEFAQAASLAPSPNILASWGMAARWAGDRESEERAFTILLQRVPADRIAVRAAAYTGLARLAYERGEVDKAKGLLTQALQLDPQDRDARGLAARIVAGAPAGP